MDVSHESEWTKIFDRIHKHAKRLEPCVNPSEQPAPASWQVVSCTSASTKVIRPICRVTE